MLEKILTDILLGASLSVDAFAVTVGEGLSNPCNRTKSTIWQAAYFGLFQGAMPLLGFFLAGTVSGKIMSLGPYISFAMLALVGGKMLLDAIRKKADDTHEEGKKASFSHSRTILLAIATSIDALAVGVSFAFTESSVWLPCGIIAATTFLVCLIGGLLCSRLPRGSGKGAGIIGGLVLIGIGTKLLLDGIL